MINFIIRPPEGSTKGWDAADALDGGWTPGEASKFVDENKFTPDDFLEWTIPLIESEKKEIQKTKKTAKERLGFLDLLGGGNDDGPKQSQILIDLASDAEIFHTPGMEAFATFEMKGHKENWPVLSRPFKFFLIEKFIKQEGKPPSAQAMKEALGALEAKAWFEGSEYEVFLRLGEVEGTIYLDLCNENWEVIEINSSGWRITNDPPIKFRRARGMLPLPCPRKGGSLNDLRR
ncbi:MAG: hypothetical protein QGG48_12125, partial [Desulfatiglandales bacterium]|nr:hypothetical protein [Desulfatiglandales bacterium]